MTKPKNHISMRRMTHRTRSAMVARLPGRPDAVAPGPIQSTLFGTASVTPDDLAEWLRVVAPRIPDRRAAQYLRNYNVAEKIAAAKLSGNWPPRAGYRA